MNPFITNYSEGKFGECVAGFVYCQVCDLKIGESKRVDLGGRTLNSFRTSLSKICHRKKWRKTLGSKFETRTDKEKNLWVMRIA